MRALADGGPNRWVRTKPTPRQAAEAASAAEKVSIESLIREAEKAPSKRPAVAHVIAVADDMNASAAMLGSAVGSEPVLSARVMRMANSTFYGVSGRVNTLQFAVSVLGFTTIRALAASAVLGLDDGDVPANFWEFSAAHAVGSGLIAQRLGAPPPDAFCAGLLSGMGRAVLHRFDGAGYSRAIAAAPHPDQTAQYEREWCGFSGSEVSERIFSAWKFPAKTIAAVSGCQRDPDPNPALPVEPLVRAVRAGFELAARATGCAPHADVSKITAGRVPEPEAEAMLEGLISQSEQLRDAFLA